MSYLFSLRCSCNSGFVIHSTDPTRCVDINECLTDNGGCQHNCTNTPGSYQCTCHPTFKIQSDGKSCGHCPTCSEFETLWQTVQDLKEQLVSVEVWKQSINSQGCIFDSKFKPNGTSWRKEPCEICHCQGGQTRCEPIRGCINKVASTPTTIRGNEPLTDEEDDDEVDATAASGDNSPTTSTTDITTPGRNVLTNKRLQPGGTN